MAPAGAAALDAGAGGAVVVGAGAGGSVLVVAGAAGTVLVVGDVDVEAGSGEDDAGPGGPDTGVQFRRMAPAIAIAACVRSHVRE